MTTNCTKTNYLGKVLVLYPLTYPSPLSNLFWQRINDHTQICILIWHAEANEIFREKLIHLEFPAVHVLEKTGLPTAWAARYGAGLARTVRTI
jgi:hypothetical protein